MGLQKSIIKFVSVVKSAFGEWHRHDMMKEGAVLAFYGVFSLAPLLFLLSKMAASLFGIATLETAATQLIGRFSGASGGALVQALVGNAYHASSNPLLGIIGIGILIFGATNFFIHITEALDMIGQSKNDNSGWIRFIRYRAKAFLLVIFSGFLLAIFLFTTTAIGSFGNFLTRHFAIPFWFLWFLNFSLSFVVAVLLFASLYRLLPTSFLSWRNAILGALFTAVFLLVGEYILGWAFAEGLVASYGIPGAVIAFLTWIYYSALLFLFGAEVSYGYAAKK